MPFGFWVLGNSATAQLFPELEGTSQMPFGFWVLGNQQPPLSPNTPTPRVSNAFRLLGSGEPFYFEYKDVFVKMSQMPFGFWVLGNSLFVRHSV